MMSPQAKHASAALPRHLHLSRVLRPFVVAALIVAGCHSPNEHSRPAMGMFADAALTNPRFVWDSVRTARLTVYAPRDSYASARVAQYRNEAETAIDHALAILGEAEYPAHLQVFVLRSREDDEAITGNGANGWADPAGNNVGVVARPDCRPVFKHEIMHAVSLKLRGNPLAPDIDPYPPKDPILMQQGGWLREGLAAAAEDRYVSNSYRGMAHLQAGSLVNYLLERYGRERFRAVWREGVSAFERVYGRTASQIERDWHAWLRATPTSERPRSIAFARSEDLCPPRRR